MNNLYLLSLTFPLLRIVWFRYGDVDVSEQVRLSLKKHSITLGEVGVQVEYEAEDGYGYTSVRIPSVTAELFLLEQSETTTTEDEEEEKEVEEGEVSDIPGQETGLAQDPGLAQGQGLAQRRRRLLLRQLLLQATQEVEIAQVFVLTCESVKRKVIGVTDGDTSLGIIVITHHVAFLLHIIIVVVIIILSSIFYHLIHPTPFPISPSTHLHPFLSPHFPISTILQPPYGTLIK